MKNSLWMILIFFVCAESVFAQGTVFHSVHPDVLPAAEMQEMRDMAESFRQEDWQAGERIFQKMIVLYRDKMVPEAEASEEIFIPVGAFCKKLLEDFAARMPKETYGRLLKKWEFFDAAEEPSPKNFPPTEKSLPEFRCTMTRIFDETGRVLYQDAMPETSWKSLLPPGTRGRNFSDSSDVTKEDFPEHLFYAPETRTLIARMGTPVSAWPERERDTRPQGHLIALDMRAEGRLLWIKRPDSPEWAFVGNPLADGTYVYIPMMRQAAAPEFYLAAINLQDGTYAWRRFLFSVTPGPEMTPPVIIYLPQKMAEEEIVVGNKEVQNVEVTLQKSGGKILRVQK